MRIPSIAKIILCALAALLLLTSCGQQTVDKVYRNDLTAPQVGEQLLSSLPEGTGRHAAGEGYVSRSSFGDQYQTLLEKSDSYVIYVSDVADTNIDEIGVFHITDPKDIATAERIIQEYVTATQLRLADLLASYNPGETPKLDNAQVTVRGQYILYSILSRSDTATVRSALEQYVKAL